MLSSRALLPSNTAIFYSYHSAQLQIKVFLPLPPSLLCSLKSKSIYPFLKRRASFNGGGGATGQGKAVKTEKTHRTQNQNQCSLVYVNIAVEVALRAQSLLSVGLLAIPMIAHFQV